MTVIERVRELISRIAPGAACDDCLADKLALTIRQHANHKTRLLQEEPGFTRGLGECTFCKADHKKVIRVAQP